MPAPGPTPSLQAFEQYVKGLLAEQPATQASFLEAALKLDPRYHRARLALWEVRTSQGDHAAALAAARAVGAASPDAAARAVPRRRVADVAEADTTRRSRVLKSCRTQRPSRRS